MTHALPTYTAEQATSYPPALAMLNFIPTNIPGLSGPVVDRANHFLSSFLLRTWCFLTTVLLGSSILTGPHCATLQGVHLKNDFPSDIDLLSATIQDLQACLVNGTITSVQLTKEYLVRDCSRTLQGRSTDISVVAPNRGKQLCWSAATCCSGNSTV